MATEFTPPNDFGLRSARRANYLTQEQRARDGLGIAGKERFAWSAERFCGRSEVVRPVSRGEMKCQGGNLERTHKLNDPDPYSLPVARQTDTPPLTTKTQHGTSPETNHPPACFSKRTRTPAKQPTALTAFPSTQNPTQPHLVPDRRLPSKNCGPCPNIRKRFLK